MTRKWKGVFGVLLVLAATLQVAPSLPTPSLADVLARARNEDTSPRLQVLESEENLSKNASATMEDPGTDGDDMNNVLEYLELEALDANDPRMNSPDGLTVLSHSGNAITFTKQAGGKVSLNGAPLDGVQTLPDGTEVYTLERFLRDHKGRLDEAFSFLSQQANRLQPRARNLDESEVTLATSEHVETASQVPRPAFKTEISAPRVVVSEVTEISSETSAPVTSITLTKFSMSSLSDKPVLSSEADIPEPAPGPSDAEASPATEALFDIVEEPVSRTEIPVKTSTAEPIPVTDWLFEASPEEPIPVTDSVFESHVESEVNTEFVFEPVVAEPVPVTESVWDPSAEEPVPVTSISMKAVSTDVEQETRLDSLPPESVTPSTVELSSVDADLQTEHLFEAVVTEPIATEVPSLDNTSLTEPPIEISSVEPVSITEELFKSLQKPSPTTEPMNGLSHNISSEHTAREEEEGERVTEISFSVHAQNIPQTEIPDVESSPVIKIINESSSDPTETEEIVIDATPTTLAPLERIEIESTHSEPATETEKHETTEEANALPIQEITGDHKLPQHTADAVVDEEHIFTELWYQLMIPQIPVAAEESGIPLIEVWKEALNRREVNESEAVQDIPGLILSPDYITMVNLVPQDAPHPLYGDDPETSALRAEFLLDYLVSKPLDFEDPRLMGPEGLSVENLGGKELVFFVDDFDNFTVNGVPVEGTDVLLDGTLVIIISDFLFDHRQMINEAFEVSVDSSALVEENVQEKQEHTNETLLTTHHEVSEQVDSSSTANLTVPAIESATSTDSLEPVVSAVEDTMKPKEESIPVTEQSTKVEDSTLSEANVSAEESRNTTEVPQIVTEQPIPHIENTTAEQTVVPPVPVTADPLFTVPRIPLIVEQSEATSLINLWRHALRLQDSSATLRDDRVPKTLISPDYFLVVNLVPQDAPHPLYDDAPENEALRTEFLLDYMVLDPINVEDPKISSPEGITVTNLAGKDLTIAADPRGKISINGVAVEMVEILEDGTQVYTLEDFLFDHRARVDEAFHLLSSQPSEFGPLGEPLNIQNPAEPEKDFLVELVPRIPLLVDAEESSSLLNLWRHALREQDSAGVLRDDAAAPKTILSPDFLEMGNLVPQDAPHPLYVDGPKFVALRTEFLLDYLVQEPIDVEDPAISDPTGITVTNLAGHQLNFFADSSGKLRVNGVPVKMIEILDDGTQVYTLADFLFEHRARVDDAFLHLISQPAEFGPLGEPLEITEPPQIGALTVDHALLVPKIPKLVDEEDASSLVYLWRFAVKQQAPFRDDREPKTILSPDFFVLMNLVPQDVPNPLYDSSPENVALRTEFLLDYMIQDPIDVEDPRMAYPKTLNVTNFGGKELSFVRQEDGSTSINGIPVEAVEVLSDGTQVYTLATFLFDHRQMVEEAFKKLVSQKEGLIGTPRVLEKEQSSVSEPVKTSQADQPSTQPQEETMPELEDLSLLTHETLQKPSDGPEGSAQSSQVTPQVENNKDLEETTFTEPEESGVTVGPPSVPKIPQIVDAGEFSTLLDLWRHALRMQDISATLRDNRVPKTVLSPDYKAFSDFVPHDSPHPLYDDNEFPGNEFLRAEVLLDYLIEEPVSAQDPRISTPEGLTVTNLGGKELTFTADEQGNFLINGVPVEHAQTLTEGTQVYTLAEFLFDHKAQVHEALRSLIGQPAEFGPLGEPVEDPLPVTSPEVGVDAYPLIVPRIPQLVDDGEVSSLLNLWRNALELQDSSATLRNDKEPKTLLSPDFIRVVNLVPQDSPNPLYNDAPEDIALSRELLLDYMILEPVNIQDPRITQAGGLRVTNFNGKEIIFSIDSQDNLIVNGVPVEAVESLADGTQVFTLEDLLFDHQRQVDDAYRRLISQTSSFEPFWEPPANLPGPAHSNAKSLHDSEIKQSETEVLPETGSDKLGLDPQESDQTLAESVNTEIKSESVSTQTVTEIDQQFLSDFPQTASEPDEKEFSPEIVETPANLDRQVSPDSPQTEIDLVLQPINSGQEELAAQTLLGAVQPSVELDQDGLSEALPTAAELLQPESHHSETDSLVVAESDNMSSAFIQETEETVPVETELLQNPPESDILSDALTEVDSVHLTPESDQLLVEAGDPQLEVDQTEYELIPESIGVLSHSEEPQSEVDQVQSELVQAASESTQTLSEPKQTAAEEDQAPHVTVNDLSSSVPRIPQMVDEGESSSLLNIWRHALQKQDSSITLRDNREPKTLLSPDFLEVMNLVPQDAPHPLYDDSPENDALRIEFLLDYMALEPINVQDPQIASPEGLTVPNLAGKSLSFAVDSEGQLRINNVPVEMIEILEDGTQVYTLADFLFEHRARVDDAFLHLISQPAEFGPLGEPLDAPIIKAEPQSEA